MNTLDNYLDKFFRDFSLLSKWNKVFYYPNKEGEVKISLPGVGKDNISVSELDNDTIEISIKGEKEPYQSIYCDKTGYDSPEVSYIDGILLLKFNEKQKKEVKKIEIN